MTEEEKTSLLNEQYSIVLSRKADLSSMNDICTEIAMGVATPEDYAEQIAQAEIWRQDILNANAEIERLKAIEVDPQPTTEM